MIGPLSLLVLATGFAGPALAGPTLAGRDPLAARGVPRARSCEVHDLRDAVGRAFAIVRPDSMDPDAGCGSRIEGPGFSLDATIRRARDGSGPFFVFEAAPEVEGDRTTVRQMFIYPKTGGYGYAEAVFVRGELLETVYYPLMPAGERPPRSEG